MTDKVISLEQFKEQRNIDDDGPFLAGPAMCVICKHEWAAVAPVGTFDLECPSCGFFKGHFKFAVDRDVVKDENGVNRSCTWTCNCGCDLFRITPERIYSPNCGVDPNGFL